MINCYQRTRGLQNKEKLVIRIHYHCIIISRCNRPCRPHLRIRTITLGYRAVEDYKFLLAMHVHSAYVKFFYYAFTCTIFFTIYLRNRSYSIVISFSKKCYSLLIEIQLHFNNQSNIFKTIGIYRATIKNLHLIIRFEKMKKM